LNKDKLTSLINEKCIDIIVHTVGKPLVADCAHDPYNAYKINSLGVASILEAARNSNVKKTIVIETDKVYGFQIEIPTKEDAKFNPNSPYELSKAMGAEICNFYRKHYKMNIISVRPVNIFGPGDHSYTRIIPAAMKNILEGKGIPVQEQAINMSRDFIYVKDVTKMLYLLAMKNVTFSIYNLSTNNPITIMELANIITDILCHEIKPKIIPKPGKYSEIPYQSIDGSRFINEFNFKFTPLIQAISETYMGYQLCKLL